MDIVETRTATKAEIPERRRTTVGRLEPEPEPTLAVVFMAGSRRCLWRRRGYWFLRRWTARNTFADVIEMRNLIRHNSILTVKILLPLASIYVFIPCETSLYTILFLLECGGEKINHQHALRGNRTPGGSSLA